MLKKILKWTGIVLLVILAGLYIYVITHQRRTFSAPFPNVKAVTDSAVIARGKHLVFGPAHCANCHASPDMADRVLKGETVPLAGGYAFDIPIGKIFAKNLTPDKTGIGDISDGQIAR